MSDKKIKTIALTAMFTALTCVATMVISIPSPLNGYINIGDCIVLLSAWILGPLYGTIAAAAGSALADILLAYTHYAPGTFVIKGAMAIVACIIFRALINRKKSPEIKLPYIAVATSLSSICSELIMIGGYFLYAALFLGKGMSAYLSVPGNAIQGGVSAILAIIIYSLMISNKYLSAKIKALRNK